MSREAHVQFCEGLAGKFRWSTHLVVHGTSKAEAEKVLEAIRQRLAEVKLQIKEEKTRIAYCKDYRRKARHEVVKFEFLGFSYQPRARKSNRDGKRKGGCE